MKKILLLLGVCPLLFGADALPDYVKHYNAGVAAQKSHEYESAIKHYQDALSEKSDFADAWNNLGYCNRMVAKSYLTKAGEAYDKALRYQPKHEKALEYQGEYFVMMGQLHYAYHNYQVLTQMKSKEAAQLKEKLDTELKEAQSVLKTYIP